MKHYISIERLKLPEGNENVLKAKDNTQAFYQGDIISITEKIDGANASIRYDKDEDKLRCFSSRNELDFSNQLRGFLPYVESLDKAPFQKYPDYIFFGEWLVKHSIIYNQECYNQWYLFSVYDTINEVWLPQEFVKGFASEYGFNYPKELYYGPFMSWDHCISFSMSPSYGDQQEGIVIKNQTALKEERGPHILKYVNPSFKEVQKSNRIRKMLDPQKLQEKAEAEEYMRMIVTDARVIKLYHKFIDEGILPEVFEPRSMKDIARNLPRRVYEDCAKEEMDTLQKAGEYAGKLCNKVTMEIIKSQLGL